MAVEVTALGWMFIPACLLVMLRRRWLLPWAIFWSIFQAASVLNVVRGDYVFGVQPGYFAAALWLLVAAPGLVRATRGDQAGVLSHTYAPLAIFVILAGVSAVIIPVIFAGDLTVFPPRSGLHLSSAAPLEPRSTNLSQVLYLVFLAILAWGVATEVMRDGLRTSVKNAFVAATFGLALVGFYQVITTSTGLPYAGFLINSNPGYAHGVVLQVGFGITRLSSTLTEPSIAGYHLVGVFALFSWLLLERRGRAALAAAVLSGTALLMTASTTALLTLVGISLLFWRARRGRASPLTPRRMLAVALVVAGSVLIILLLWSLVSSRSVLSIVQQFFSFAFFQKIGSESYLDRTGVDLASTEIFHSTGGLGAGWGSTRASSLLVNIAANSGLWGLMLLGIFAVRVSSLLAEARSYVSSEDPWLTGLGWATTAMLICGAISIPDVTYLTFWFVLAALIGEAARRQARRGRLSAPHPLGTHSIRLERGRIASRKTVR